MTDPIVFISRNRIKEGMAEAFYKHYTESIPAIESGKPGTIVQVAYESEYAVEVVIVRVFPSAEALDYQLRGADERSKRAYEYIEPVAVEIYGTPSSYTLDMMGKVAGSGISVKVYPHFIGGFMRLKPP